MQGERPARTMLEQIIRERRQTFEEFSADAERFSIENRLKATLSPRHLHRLASGHRADGRPVGPVRPATRRLLEQMLHLPVERLLSPPEVEPEGEDRPESSVLTAAMQVATDAALAQVADDVRERFSRLSTDESASAALHWIDRVSGAPDGTSRGRVAEKLVTTDVHELRVQGERRSRVGLGEITRALRQYYGHSENPHDVLYRIRCAGTAVSASILTRREWLDISVPLRSNLGLTNVEPRAADTLHIDEIGADAAAQRVAEVLTAGVRLVNAPLYSLVAVSVGPDGIHGTARVAEFATYALTLDLLEGELLDAVIAGGKLSLPLRDRYLPDLTSVTQIDQRLCVGGPLALCAIARPADPRRGRKADYCLLVQKRSGHVLNAAHRLAVIPKGFHGPMTDYSGDVQLISMVEREMEEELFGRTDIDSTRTGPRTADPMHPNRLSAPMAWLDEHPGAWSVECTGFGFNLLSGNFEAASLITITDENWWRQFGDRVEANWEAAALRQYSSLDRDALTHLVCDPSWSGEGLFALVQGLRRLAETDPERTNLPMLALETEEPRA